MQVEALERRYTPVMAALMGAGVRDADRIVDEARDAFDRLLAQGPEMVDNEVTRLSEFRKRMGVA